MKFIKQTKATTKEREQDKSYFISEKLDGVYLQVHKKDDNIVIKYGTIVMNIQKSSSSSAQSPFVEFTLYQTYIAKEDYNRALEVIKSLDKIELSKTERSRQKYLLGSVYSKLWRDDESKAAYGEAIEAEPSGVWAELATSAKDI